MNNNLILRVLNSPYNDVTKSSVLSQADVDNNFIYLKGDLIYTATTDGDVTYLHKYNGETISFLGGSGGGSVFTGGTVTGPTNFTNGLTANTITGNGSGLTNIPISGVTNLQSYLNNYVTGGTYWVSGSTGNYSVKANNDSALDALGNYSLAEGFDTNSLSDYSHTEGNRTTAGWRGFTVDNVTDNVVSITGYGNLSGIFNVRGRLYFEGSSDVNFYSATTWDGSVFKIYTTNYGSIGSAQFVAPLNILYSTLADRFGGESSHAEGDRTIAYGRYSHVEGSLAYAYGDGSHSEGAGTRSFGYYSHAEGYGTIAYGDYAHTEGRETIGYGDGSHSEGAYTTAGWKGFTVSNILDGVVTLTGYGDLSSSFNGSSLYNDSGIITPYSGTSWNDPDFNIFLTNSPSYFAYYVADVDKLYQSLANRTKGGNNNHAEGITTKAVGDGSHAQGRETTAFGYYSHAEGVKTKAIGSGSHAQGGYYDNYTDTYYSGGTALGKSSHAEGIRTTAIGIGSHADGYRTTSIGDYSHSEGEETIASGDTSHAEGNNTLSIGYGSHAEGGGTTSIGYRSHAEGYLTTSVGDNSHAGGSGTIAFGDNSHSEGYQTTAIGISSHAEGGNTYAIGIRSHAEGNLTMAVGGNSHAEGYNAKSGWRGFTVSNITNGVVTLTGYGDLSSLFGYYGGTLYDENANLTPYSGISWSNPNFEIYLTNSPNYSASYVADTDNLYDALADQLLGDTSHSEGSFTSAIGYASHAEGYSATAFGLHSHVEGVDTTAKGDDSHAGGNATTAIGSASHSEGYNTIAFGDNSHAEGGSTTAIGEVSHAEGGSTTAIGVRSHAEGDTTTASGNTSHAEGGLTISIGDYSHSEGYQTTAVGDISHAEGSNTKSGWRGFAVSSISAGVVTITGYGDLTSSFNASTLYNEYGYQTPYSGVSWINPNFEIYLTDSPSYSAYYVADITNLYDALADQLLGDNSHSEGDTTKAIGAVSHAEGSNTTAFGVYSHSEGDTTKAIGQTSHAEGYQTTALNDQSHSEGYQTTAMGISSHAEGTQTTGIGQNSHSEGYLTTALGTGSHSEGYYTSAGWRGFNVSSISAGVVTLTGYGDLSSSFGASGTLLNNYGSQTPYSAITWTTPNFNIYLTDSPSYSANFVAAINNLDDVLGDFYGAEYSHAEGSYNTTLGYYSHAEGTNNKAFGDSSHAEGVETTSIGGGSHSEGYQTTANGDNSHSEGYQTTAFGESSHSEGYQTTAMGISSHAEGKNTTAVGETSHAEGDTTTSISNYSHAEGSNTRTGWRGFYISDKTNGIITITDYGDLSASFNAGGGLIIDTNDTIPKSYTASTWSDPNFLIYLSGNPINYTPSYIADTTNLYDPLADYFSGNYSHAEGNNTSAIDRASHAEGSATTAFGQASHSEGNGTLAYGTSSHAEGLSTTSNGSVSHAEGSGSIANGIASHAEGSNTEASGESSHAEGSNTISIGDNSHSEGTYTTAGWKGFTVYSVTTGLVRITGYGDLSSSFNASGTLYYLNGQSVGLATYSSTTWNDPYFEINLTDSNSFTASYVADSSKLSESLANNLLGDGSHAEGDDTTSIGLYSHAEGGRTTSIGIHSHAEGGTSRAIGNKSHAEGEGTTSIGSGSHAEGAGTTANGDTSHAEGYNTTSYFPSSHSEGSETVAYAYYSHAEGVGTRSIGYGSHAEGAGTIASGNTSHAEGGYYNQFTGIYYSGGTAMGNGSHAEGHETTSIGNFSHSEGYLTTAVGNYSFVHGTGSTAQANTSIVLGNNITGTSSNTVYVSNFNIKTLGGGTSINNLGIDVNGNVVTGTIITGGTYFSGITTFTSNAGSAFTVTGYYAPYELKNYSGSTFGEKLQTAINSVPSGATIDCSNTIGITLQINSSINVTKPLNIFLGDNLITASVGSGNSVFNILSSSVTIKGVGSSSKSSDLAGRTRITMTNGNWHIYSVGNNALKFEDFDCIGIQSTNYKFYSGTTTPKTAPYSFNNDGSGGIFVAEGDPYVVGGGNTVSKLVIQNLFIYQTMNSGILLLGGITSRIENCRISSAAGHGIYVGSSTTTLSLINNYVSSSVLAGICLDGVATSVLISNATEAAGIGLWLKSCQSVEIIGHYSEACGTRDTTRMPDNTGLFINNSLGGQYITDIGTDNLTLFRGSSYVVTGGRNIYLPNPYSNNPGSPNTQGSSTQTRHILVRGNTREIYLLNPRCTSSVGYGGTPRFDIGIENLSTEIPRDVNLFFNPTLDGTITPTIAGKYITQTDSSGESTVVLDQGSNTRIQSGANVWTYDVVSRTVVTGNTYTTLPNDKLIVFTGMSSSKTITLLTPPSGSNVIYSFKDESGLANTTNKITLIGQSSKTINGLSSFDLITTPNGFGAVYYDGSNWDVINYQPASTVIPYNNVGSATTITWNVSGVSTNYEVTLTGASTLNLTNVRNGDYGTIIVKQDTVGSRTLSFGTVNGGAVTHKVVNGGAGVPTLTSNASAIDLLSFTYNGTFMFWTVGNDYN